MQVPPEIPLYQKIKSDILGQIEHGYLKPGDKIPTERALMEQYRVSRITVSKALSELKEEGIVTRHPNRGTFVSSKEYASPAVVEAPSTLREPTALTALPEIACIIPTIKDSFSTSMVNGVLSAFPPEDYLVHIFPSRNSATENMLMQHCLEHNIAGIVLFPQDQAFFSNQLLYMQLNNYPLVLLDRYLPRLDTSYVIADNDKAGEMCVRHLHELGHQRIAFITSSLANTFPIKHRLAGVYKAAKALDIPEQDIRVVSGFDQSLQISKHQELFNKLIYQDKVTAFITAQSSACAYLYQAFQHMGIRVPEDISLITFDRPNTPNVAPDFFTHIDQSEYLMGHHAGTLLRNRIEKSDLEIHHSVITPTLRYGSSTSSAIL
ncbi:MAG: GntR family transcriptional regulator [Acetatifactor sp.]|nr:GntR family transcriptional regulator [Acetatifactor sp.]